VLDDLRPAAVPDRTVAETDPELHFGLFRTDGSAKPAAAVVRRAFSGAPPLGFNGGFEHAVAADAGTAVPAKWSMQGEQALFALDRDAAKEGGASARVAPTTTPAGSASLSITPPNGGLRGDERVVLTAWARRADAGGRVFAVVESFDGARRLVGRVATAPLPSDSTSWRRLYVAARAPRRARYLRIDLVVQHATGPVWFDGVSFGVSPRR
jgi:hypothetical protein